MIRWHREGLDKSHIRNTDTGTRLKSRVSLEGRESAASMYGEDSPTTTRGWRTDSLLRLCSVQNIPPVLTQQGAKLIASRPHINTIPREALPEEWRDDPPEAITDKVRVEPVSPREPREEPEEEPEPEPQKRASGGGLEAALMDVAEQAAGRVLDERVERFRQDAENLRSEVEDRVAEAMQEIEARAPREVYVVTDTERRKVEGETHEAFEEVLETVAHGTPCMTVGPTGCGKSYLWKQVAQALGKRYGHTSVNAGVTEIDLFGGLLPTGEGGRFEYNGTRCLDYIENGGLWLFDEIDGADPNVLLAMQSLFNSDRELSLPRRFENPVAKAADDFLPAAAGNTWGAGADRQYVGRLQQDAAVLNRWQIGMIYLDYDRKLEAKIIRSQDLLDRFWKIRDKAREARLQRNVSTRDLEYADRFIASGAWDADRAAERLVRSWTPDERRAVGEAA